MQDFQKLDIWQKSHALTLQIYEVTATYPNNEQFGLMNQMRRSAASIPTNIAEGCGRNSKPDFARFIDIALGSANELHYQLILSRDLKYIDSETFDKSADNVIEVRRMMYGFRSNLAHPNRKTHN